VNLYSSYRLEKPLMCLMTYHHHHPVSTAISKPNF